MRLLASMTDSILPHTVLAQIMNLGDSITLYLLGLVHTPVVVVINHTVRDCAAVLWGSLCFKTDESEVRCSQVLHGANLTDKVVIFQAAHLVITARRCKTVVPAELPFDIE